MVLPIMDTSEPSCHTYKQIGDGQHRLSATMQPVHVRKALVVHFQSCSMKLEFLANCQDHFSHSTRFS